ncbi:MAG: type 2 isopentenyl-diphosphate Delta-isomerase [Ignavibacteria bacterium]|nr:type 2 isopentenyl-diphosphate Delta-isomerase [Ignavibacteria bacterium]MBT8382668.1 type 2 isopentenyl-diphosphate Delta-isomerase [Ignavibacteria bacterium]MBT8391749.1 type 2 isopentenyl-diphosphate Delta-isomerase [Ignavibacteria bacterium]NNJ51577.1 type 2 isopentenyl-diphosphate Delta-isomerase [Ignavibacteriaceae bacterium]NNL20315.1 type 2 isopentenyl-diphosphate Delta-isomerase [Ignavibacteriaceae bacterium]
MNETSIRKKEHLDLCINEDVAFKSKTTGFERYDFLHDAITEVKIDKINFAGKFLKKKIDYPFLISCMTGGTNESEKINTKLAVVAEKLKIPVGVGSQRQALEDNNFEESYKIIRKNAPGVPVLGNIGAAEVVKYKSSQKFQKLVDLIEADAMVVHVNPLQELIQHEGNPNFRGLLKNISKLVKNLNVPVIIKEVGSGISVRVTKRLLEAGVFGIDVAGAGGTSWAGVELLRNDVNTENYFWDWGLPTSFCIKEISKLKNNYKFTIIGSGGINTSIDAAKAFALGADLVASARTVLKELDKNGVDGVIDLIDNWFTDLKKIMYLTGSNSLKQFKKNKIIRKELLY